MKTRMRIIALLAVTATVLCSCATGNEQAQTGDRETQTVGEQQNGQNEIEQGTGETESVAPETTEIAITEPEPEVITFTISAAGDATLGNTQLQGYDHTFRQMYDTQQNPGYFFQNVKPIFEEDDMTLVNFEGVLTFSEDRVEKEFNLKGDPEYISILTEGDVEAVSFGNNHHMDYGQQGHDDTVAAFAEAGIEYACDAKVGYYENKGIKVGFVSVNEVYDGKAVEAFLEEGIEELKEAEVDLIIACCHWGIELEHYPEAYQQELGRKCIDWGADLVIGGHPHVLQGIEEYNGSYIVYSLGNFCFGGNRNPKDKNTMIFQQTFTFVDGVKQEDDNIKVIPCSISSIKERNNFQPTPAEGEDAERIMGVINEYSAGFGIEFDMDGHLIQKADETGETEDTESAE